MLVRGADSKVESDPFCSDSSLNVEISEPNAGWVETTPVSADTEPAGSACIKAKQLNNQKEEIFSEMNLSISMDLFLSNCVTLKIV